MKAGIQENDWGNISNVKTCIGGNWIKKQNMSTKFCNISKQNFKETNHLTKASSTAVPKYMGEEDEICNWYKKWSLVGKKNVGAVRYALKVNFYVRPLKEVRNKKQRNLHDIGQKSIPVKERNWKWW